MELRFVEADNGDLLALVAELDAYFHENWGGAADRYAGHHDLTKMACAIVAYIDGVPAGCGCWRPFDAVTAEIKRMYVRPAYRRRKVAERIIETLEAHAAASGCHRAVLETGTDMPVAIAFYVAEQYDFTRSFGDFEGDERCCCMEKDLPDGTAQ